MRISTSTRGFTLIELMITIAVIAILAAIAIPGYQKYIKKGNASTAAADLAALSSSVENHFQRTLNYPDNMADVASITQVIKTWNPASKAALFDFSYEKNGGGTYVLKATGKALMAGCALSINQVNTRSGGGSACGGFSW